MNNYMIFYHGTTKRVLEKIRVEGIKPRGEKKSNWESGIGKSREDLVYLTNCYACYYAFSACKKDDDKAVVLKLEINPKKIQLYADEEFIFRCSGLSQEKDREKAKEDYENINPKTFDTELWKTSLEYMGTVSADFIPPECILGYSEEKDNLDFVMHCDPSVSPLNYKCCSQRYIKHLESLEYKKFGKL